MAYCPFAVGILDLSPNHKFYCTSSFLLTQGCICDSTLSFIPWNLHIDAHIIRFLAMAIAN